MENYKVYNRKGSSEMTPYQIGMDLTNVSISQADLNNGSPKLGDMIARNPYDYEDRWLVAKKYFEENYENNIPKYNFYFPIGDWSNDGHGKCDNYPVESNKPVEVVRELYLQACDKLGFSLDGYGDLVPCSGYESSYFPLETLERIISLGAVLNNDLVKFIRTDQCIETTYEFLEIILAVIKTQDPTLEISVIPQGEMFQWYGFNDQDRHIGHFGSGLFYL